jgi:hypothetical protein
VLIDRGCSAAPGDVQPGTQATGAKQHFKARQIVANLVRRERFARRLLRRAESTRAPEQVIALLAASHSEAHNAAEASRRLLYIGVESN